MTSKKLKLDCRDEAGEGKEAERGNWGELPPEVLNIIFNHLHVADLLSCSVVSKNWKKASRDVLKRGRECYAYIKEFPHDVQDLNDMIASKDFTQMFNGLHIRIRPENDRGRTAWKHEFSRSFAENILQSKEMRQKLERAKRKLKALLCGQWKYLNLDMGDKKCWEQVLSIDDALLLREIITSTSKSLQKLVVAQDLDCYFMSCCGKNFSKLKVLHAQDEDSVEESCLEKFVLEFAPNLEEITGAMLYVKVHSPGNPFMLKRMKCALIESDDLIPEAGLMEGFRSVSGLYRLNLQREIDSANPEDFNDLFSMVLKSLKTLEELYMHTSEFLNLFKTFDEMHFQNLRRLSLSTHWDTPIEDDIPVLRRLKLPKLCPNLEHLELTVDAWGEDGEYEEDGNPFEGPYAVDKSDIPLEIEIECRKGLYRHEHLEFLSQIYPKINKAKVLAWKPGYNYEMNSIFSDLHSLEYLEINVFLFDCFYAPDVVIAAMLCGINIEEAKFLFNGRPKKNAKLNRCIVPVRPSLFNAKILKELKITDVGNYPGAFVSHSWVIQVTENVPVRHVRKLVVTIESRGGLVRTIRKLNDLRAFTTLLGAQVIGNEEPGD